MQEQLFYITIAVASLGSVAIVSQVALKGWNEWIAFKRSELDHRHDDVAQPSATSRIEVADLKERLRKLEAIAAGVDL